MKNNGLRIWKNLTRKVVIFSYPHFGQKNSFSKVSISNGLIVCLITAFEDRSIDSAGIFPGESPTINFLYKKGWLARILEMIRKRPDMKTRKLAIASVIMAATIGSASAQNNNGYGTGASKADIVMAMATSQYGNITNVHTEPIRDNGTTTVVSKQAAIVNSPTDYIHGEDKYLKTKEAGKRYTEFNVYDINGKDKDQVVLGLLTNTLDRGTRYDEKGLIAKKVTISTDEIDQVDDKGNVISGQKVKISSIRFNDKIFVILGEDDYRYLDGKKLVGNEKLVDELSHGKPITELTFFYELQKAGIVDKNMTAKEFLKLDLNAKQRLLNSASVAANM